MRTSTVEPALLEMLFTGGRRGRKYSPIGGIFGYRSFFRSMRKKLSSIDVNNDLLIHLQHDKSIRVLD